ncbi:MAG: hypothetical protein AB1333_00955 [Patescibacteria group bacterium]
MLYTKHIVERIQNNSLSTTILNTISKTTGGILFSDVCREHNVQEENIRVTLWRLEKRGMIEKRENKYVLSSLGKDFFEKRKQPKKWDGKWRMIIFDIPESERTNRIWLRTQLLRAEYQSLQRSIYLGKNPLPEFLFDEIKNRKMLSYIRIIVAQNIIKNSLLSEK